MEQNFREETDSNGTIEVPIDKLWGSQTQRSLENFKIGNEKIPHELIAALVIIKKAAADVNLSYGRLSSNLAQGIRDACDKLLQSDYTQHFPLSVWQTGSATQTNMNVNEVIANMANENLGFPRGGKSPVHPNDHVNLGQSSNDTIPTAMHVSSLLAVENHLEPSLKILLKGLKEKENEFQNIVKVGRTHLMDAAPLTLGQEFSGYFTQVEKALKRIEEAAQEFRFLAQGGTAVGTGLNTHPQFDSDMAEKITFYSGTKFYPSKNKFEAMASHDTFVFVHGAVKSLATALFKIANDIRLLASGPNCGIQELELPALEPGSSIMPGKVNPTQCEALAMVCCQVIANDSAISLGASGGILELNVYKPLIIFNFLKSINLLSDAAVSFQKNCLEGLKPRKDQIKNHLDHNLMLVTALTPHIGYDKSAEIAKLALSEGLPLRQAAINSGFVTAQDFDKWVKVETMLGPA